MIRPHRIRIAAPDAAAPPGNRMRGTIAKAIFAGETVQYVVEAGGIALIIEDQTASGARPHLEPGATVEAAWSLADTLIFPGP